MMSTATLDATSRPGEPPACREALRLLSLGLWPVLIHSPFGGHPNAGKAPIGKGWGLARPTPESIRAGFAEASDAGVGLLLGEQGGIIDVEDDGCEDFESAFAEMFGGELVETMGWSARRGSHHLFRFDPRLVKYAKSKFVDFSYKGIEVRIGSLPGAAKQVQSVCPPSLMTDKDSSGKIIAMGPRTWNGVDRIAALPDSFFDLADRLFERARTAKARPAPAPAKDRDPAIRRYVQSAVDAELDRIASSVEGDRNNQLNRGAFALGQLVSAGALDRHHAEFFLLDSAARVGLHAEESAATVRSGLDAGSAQPRDLSDVGRPYDPTSHKKDRASGAKGASGANGAMAQAPHEDADEAPIPVRPWPAPPGEDAWHGPAGDFARAVAPFTEADPIGVLAQFLVGFGSMIGRNAFFQINATRHYLNLFCCTAGSTAVGRKGTAWDIVRAGLSQVDPDFVMNRITSGLSSGEGLIWEVRDKVEVEEETGRPGGPKVREMVLKDAGVSDKRLLVVETELGGTLKVMTREGNTLSALVRQAWDSGILRTLTKSNINRATDAHISIIGHVTEFEVVKYLSQNEASNGFANRFLWLVVRQSKLLPDGAAIPADLMRPILARVADAARMAVDPIRMERDPAARPFWHETYARLSRPKVGLIASITSRAIPYVMRLSCLYALLDLSPVVRIEHLKAGLALWEYCDRSASFVFGASLGDKDADKLMAALKAHPPGLSRAEIRSDVYGRHKSSDEIAAVLARLQEAGLVESERVKTDGRTATLWRAL